MATVVRPSLARAIRSVYAQRFDGRVQILIGIDRMEGDRAHARRRGRRMPFAHGGNGGRPGLLDVATAWRTLSQPLRRCAQDHPELCREQPLRRLSRRRQLVCAGASGVAAGGGQGEGVGVRAAQFHREPQRRLSVPRHLGVAGTRPRRVCQIAGWIRRHQLLHHRQIDVQRRVSGVGDDTIRRWYRGRSSSPATADRPAVGNECFAHCLLQSDVCKACIRICFGSFIVPAWIWRDTFQRRPFPETRCGRDLPRSSARENGRPPPCRRRRLEERDHEQFHPVTGAGNIRPRAA